MQSKQITNRLDVSRLLETIAAVDAQPHLAPSQFRISKRLLGAAANSFRVQAARGIALDGVESSLEGDLPVAVIPERME
jgi:hypothetical protein